MTRHVSGSLGIRPDRKQFTASIKIDQVRHSVRIVRNEINTGWDITCTCTGSTNNGQPMADVIDSIYDTSTGQGPSHRIASYEAWSHIDVAVSSALGD